MRNAQGSYLKTCGLVGAAAAASAVFLWRAEPLPPGLARTASIGFAALILACGAAVLVGGAVVWRRDQLLQRGAGDLFLHLNRHRSEAALASGIIGSGIVARLGDSLRRWMRLGGGLQVGDEVEVRSVEEIGRTLSADGCLDGLPFQPEMAAYCGRRMRVFRVVDKVYDYGRSRKLRRLPRTVSLAGARCNGVAHGGCQAQCSLLWKIEWLRRIPRSRSSSAGQIAGSEPVLAPAEPRLLSAERANPDRVYECQYTQLTAASKPLPPWDIRQDLHPLLFGNVAFVAYFVALFTRLFECVQSARGGIGFPPQQTTGTQRRAPTPTVDLARGTRVRVRGPDQIAETLDAKHKNRGLWFDKELLRYCRQSYVVRGRVDRIIDISSGRMRDMKTPSYLLEGATSTGEYLRLCPQEEYAFWREVWLEPEMPHSLCTQAQGTATEAWSA